MLLPKPEEIDSCMDSMAIKNKKTPFVALRLSFRNQNTLKPVVSMRIISPAVFWCCMENIWCLFRKPGALRGEVNIQPYKACSKQGVACKLFDQPIARHIDQVS